MQSIRRARADNGYFRVHDDNPDTFHRSRKCSKYGRSCNASKVFHQVPNRISDTVF